MASIPQKHRNAIVEMKAALGAEKMVDNSPKKFSAGDTTKMKTTITRALIRNFARGDKVVVNSNKDWSGKAIASYPTIESGECRGFDHKGGKEDPNGSKGAVVYVGKSSSRATDNDLGWLLAWHSTPTEDAVNKVYVECGDIKNYTTINWYDIRKKLDAATGHQAYCFDNATGAEFSADIDATGIDPNLGCVIDVKD